MAPCQLRSCFFATASAAPTACCNVPLTSSRWTTVFGMRTAAAFPGSACCIRPASEGPPPPMSFTAWLPSACRPADGPALSEQVAPPAVAGLVGACSGALRGHKRSLLLGCSPAFCACSWSLSPGAVRLSSGMPAAAVLLHSGSGFACLRAGAAAGPTSSALFFRGNASATVLGCSCRVQPPTKKIQRLF